MSSSFYLKVFLPGVKLFKKYEGRSKVPSSISVGFSKGKKSILTRRLVPIIRRGCLWYFQRNPFLFSLNKICTFLQKILHISCREYFVILPHKDHLKRRCSNNQARGTLIFPPKVFLWTVVQAWNVYLNDSITPK